MSEGPETPGKGGARGGALMASGRRGEGSQNKYCVHFPLFPGETTLSPGTRRPRRRAVQWSRPRCAPLAPPRSDGASLARDNACARAESNNPAR
jgi:hypothetical protein